MNEQLFTQQLRETYYGKLPRLLVKLNTVWVVLSIAKTYTKGKTK